MNEPTYGYCSICHGRIDRGMQWTLTRQMNRVHADQDRCVQVLRPEITEQFLADNPRYQWPGT